MCNNIQSPTPINQKFMIPHVSSTFLTLGLSITATMSKWTTTTQGHQPNLCRQGWPMCLKLIITRYWDISIQPFKNLKIYVSVPSSAFYYKATNFARADCILKWAFLEWKNDFIQFLLLRHIQNRNLKSHKCEENIISCTWAWPKLHSNFFN